MTEFDLIQGYRAIADYAGLPLRRLEISAAVFAIVKKARTYVETKVQPIIKRYWCDAAFPFELVPSFKELSLGGQGFAGYGCAGGSQKL
jgi:hypothetical protein